MNKIVKSNSALSMLVVFLMIPRTLWALDLLPYTNRTHPYSGWSSSTQGDIRTVGMAGATVGLADSFIATLDNPAGLAMTLNGADANFAEDTIYDGNLQNYASALNAFDMGIALNNYPWGVSFGFTSSGFEGQQYSLSSMPGETATLLTSSRQLVFSGARVFLKNHLSIGVSIALVQAQESITFANATQSNSSYSSFAPTGTLGATYRFPSRFLLGFSYRLPSTFGTNTIGNPTSGVTNFFQPLEIPSRLGMGVGWIPNRLFRMDLSFFLVGATENATLMKDDVTSVGQYSTLQPRVGSAYSFVDYKEIKGTLFNGIYLETSRIQGTPSRVHATVGVWVNPWIFDLGLGIDVSSNYENNIISLGLNLVKTMEKLDLIPTMPHPTYAGALPEPTIYSREGLPGTLTQEGKPANSGIDPIKAGLNIPHRISEKAKQIGNEMKDMGNNFIEAVEGTVREPNSTKKTHTKKIKHHKKTKHKSSTT